MPCFPCGGDAESAARARRRQPRGQCGPARQRVRRPPAWMAARRHCISRPAPHRARARPCGRAPFLMGRAALRPRPGRAGPDPAGRLAPLHDPSRPFPALFYKLGCGAAHGLSHVLRSAPYPWNNPSGSEICLALPDLLDKVGVGKYFERFNAALDIFRILRRRLLAAGGQLDGFAVGAHHARTS